MELEKQIEELLDETIAEYEKLQKGELTHTETSLMPDSPNGGMASLAEQGSGKEVLGDNEAGTPPMEKASDEDKKKEGEEDDPEDKGPPQELPEEDPREEDHKYADEKEAEPKEAEPRDEKEEVGAKEASPDMSEEPKAEEAEGDDDDEEDEVEMEKFMKRLYKAFNRMGMVEKTGMDLYRSEDKAGSLSVKQAVDMIVSDKHEVQDVLPKVPEDQRDDVLAQLRGMKKSESYDAEDLTKSVLSEDGVDEEDIDALLTEGDDDVDVDALIKSAASGMIEDHKVETDERLSKMEEILATMSETLEKVARQPSRGHRSVSGLKPLQKSIHPEDEAPTLSKSQVLDKLLDMQKSGKPGVTPQLVSKFELSGNMDLVKDLL